MLFCFFVYRERFRFDFFRVIWPFRGRYFQKTPQIFSLWPRPQKATASGRLDRVNQALWCQDKCFFQQLQLNTEGNVAGFENLCIDD